MSRRKQHHHRDARIKAGKERLAVPVPSDTVARIHDVNADLDPMQRSVTSAHMVAQLANEVLMWRANSDQMAVVL